MSLMTASFPITGKCNLGSTRHTTTNSSCNNTVTPPWPQTRDGLSHHCDDNNHSLVVSIMVVLTTDQCKLVTSAFLGAQLQAAIKWTGEDMLRFSHLNMGTHSINQGEQCP
jgi:hypothetical protein